METYIYGVITGIFVTALSQGVVLLYRATKQVGSPLDPLGSPVVSRRPTQKRKPKVQDDLKAWQEEQKNPTPPPMG